MQTVYIDLIPQQIKPVINASQFDDNRLVRFMLLENGEEFTLSGNETVTVNIRKPDRNIVVITPTIGANNYVDVYFTEQACACFGTSFGELVIDDVNAKIGTCNFDLDVEISPEFGGIRSTSEINNLRTQIEEIASEIIGEDYYNKTEVNDLLSAKADASDVYTKTQTDTLLSAKADASDVYTKEQTYTQTEVDNLLFNMLPVINASGSIASFNVGIEKKLKSITVDNSATIVTRCGVNLWDEQWELGIWNSDGTQGSSNRAIRCANYILVTPNTTYYLKMSATYATGLIIRQLAADKSTITTTQKSSSGTFTTDANCRFIVFCTYSADNITEYDNGISINYPSTDTEYHAYVGEVYPAADIDDITTLNGVNNIFADAGEVSVQAYDSIQHYIDNH